MTYIISTLKSVSLDTILACFNEAFSDYSQPMHLDKEALKAMMLRNNTELSLSPASFDEEGKLVGFMLIGIGRYQNKVTGYIGGAGVVPCARGNSLTKEMFNSILPKLKREGIEILYLEVISTNVVAKGIYEALGFEKTRDLYCYSGDIKLFTYDGEVIVRLLVDYDWSLFESFWDTHPSWQNGMAAVEKLIDTIDIYGAYNESDLVGYIAYNPKNQQIAQLAVQSNHRHKGVAKALIHHVICNHPRSVKVLNVDSDAEITISLLESLGLNRFVEQYEMSKELTK